MRKRRKLEGTLTVEAAFALPITFYALFLFLHMFLVMQIQLEVMQKVHEYVGRLQRYGGAYETLRNRGDSEKREGLLSELGFDTQIGRLTDAVYLSLRIGGLMEDSPYLAFIKNGKEGFCCSGSSLFSSEGHIRLQVAYTVKLPFSILGLGDRELLYRVDAKAFSGSEGYDRAYLHPPSGDETEQMVYVAPTGEVYHTDSRCTYLRVSVRKILRENIGGERSQQGAIYYPCELCGRKPSVYVYITAHGTRFHADPECRDIYHNQQEMSLSAAKSKGLRACSKCSGEKDSIR